MIRPILILLVGIVFGRFILPGDINVDWGNIILAMLGVVVFCAGADVGCKKVVFQKIRENPVKILLVPLCTVMGSVLGGLAAGWALGMAPHESTAISAGLGYYSLSVGLFNEMGAPELAALAFLSNNLREILSLVLIPIVIKYIGPWPGMSIGGATTMDITLPMISQNSDDETTIIAMIHGVILTILVPFLVPLFYSLGK